MVTLKQQDQEQLDKAKDLLETGPAHDAGFVRSLYFGRLRLDKVMPYPRPVLDEAQRADALCREVDAFLEAHVDADAIDAAERIPQEVIDGLGRLGVLGMTVPESFGGGGFGHTAYCRVLERIAQHCASTAVLVGAHQSIGLKALLLNGTQEQKQRFLPDLATGRKLAAFCLSEPEVGSDAANVQTTAQLSDDGGHWLINGEKKFATNAAVAGFMTVMARTPVQVDGETKQKVTAFIVTPDLPGFEVVSANRSKCGIRGTWQATLRFRDMKVPRGDVLGEPGRGLRVALTVLNYGRCTLSAGCLGGARVALRMASEHARRRVQFGRPLKDFHLVKKKIARMAEAVFAMDALTYLCAGLVDRHEDDIMLETAICKLYCSEMGWRVVDDAVQIWGGEGYMREHGLERALRDARINRIVEGATEVMTAFIALTGMKSVGDEMEQVLRAARHPMRNAGRLMRFAQRESRDLLLGHAHDHTLDRVHASLMPEARTLARLTRGLARDVAGLLARHRTDIIELQLVQERIAWSVVDLYATAAVLAKMQGMIESRAGNGHDAAQLDRQLLIGRSFCHHAAERVTARRKQLRHNLDHDVLAVADAVLEDDQLPPT